MDSTQLSREEEALSRFVRWEYVHSDTPLTPMYRTKVPGGWLIKIDAFTQIHQYGIQELFTSITFYPDPNHEWNPCVSFSLSEEE